MKHTTIIFYIFLSSFITALMVGGILTYTNSSIKNPDTITEEKVDRIIKKTVNDLPEVNLVKSDISVARVQEDSLIVVCSADLIKNAPVYTFYGYTGYTEKLIIDRIMAKTKSEIKKEKIKATPVFNIRFLDK